MSDSLTLWTYDPVSGYPANGVTKSFAAWGIADDWQAEFVSGSPHSLTLDFPGLALTGTAFTRRSRVLITCDNKPFFHGYVADDTRAKSGTADNQVLHLAGIWWFLENTPFRLPVQLLQNIDSHGNPVWQTQYFTHFALNAAYQANFVPAAGGSPASVSYSYVPQDSRQMLVTLLNAAIADGAWLQFNAADLFEVPIWAATVMDISYAEGIRRQIENYDCVISFDESVTPPRIKIQQRKNLPAVSRALCQGIYNSANHIEAFSIKRRGDLAVSYVQLLYELTASINGASTIQSQIDVYPNPKPADNFQALTHTIPLGSISGTTHRAFIQTALIEPESIGWWQARKPETNPNVNPSAAVEYDSLALIGGSSRRLLDPNAFPNQIVGGSWTSWMGGNYGKDHVLVQAQYHRRPTAGRDGDKIAAHTWRTQCDCTSLNVPNGLLASFTSWSGGYVDPNTYAGMAQQIYEDLNPPGGQWEGSIPIYEPTFSGTLTIGNNFNLTGSLPSHAAMNAPIQRINVRRRTGGFYYTVEIGPNKTLHPQQIMDRMQAARYNYIFAANPLTSPQAQVLIPAAFATADNSNAEPTASAIHAFDPAGSGGVNADGNGADPFLRMGIVKNDNTLDPTQGSMYIAPASQIPAAAVAAGTGQVQLRKIGKDTAGKDCYIPSTGPLDLSGGSGAIAAVITGIVNDELLLCTFEDGTQNYVLKPFALLIKPNDTPTPEIFPAYQTAAGPYQGPNPPQGSEALNHILVSEIPDLGYTDPAGHPVLYQDINIDARAWAVELTDCEYVDPSDPTKGTQDFKRFFVAGPRH